MRIRWTGCKDTFLCENLEGKRLLGGPWHRWDENIKMNLKETKYEGVG